MTSKSDAACHEYHTITPAIIVRGAAQAIDFYKRAFGARERIRMPTPDGKGIMHAELEIGDSCLFVSDECPSCNCHSPAALGGCTASLHVRVPDVDAAFERAVDAGATALMPVENMFWGDRYGSVKDPFGHQWGLATHVEDVSPEQIAERAREWFAKASKELCSTSA